jgi:hypothetical protein
MPSNSRKTLRDAIVNDDIEIVENQIAYFNINDFIDSDLTPLVLAVLSNSFKVINFFSNHPEIDLRVNGQGLRIFILSLACYYNSVGSEREKAVTTVLNILAMHEQINLNDESIQAEIKNKIDLISRLIRLVAQNQRPAKNFFEQILKSVKLQSKIGKIYEKLGMKRQALFWFYHSAKSSLQAINQKGPEATCMMPVEHEKYFLLSLNRLVEFYYRNSQHYKVTASEAFIAALQLGKIYLLSDMSKSVEYFARALDIGMRSEQQVNQISLKFLQNVTDYFPVPYDAKSTDEINRFSSKIAAVISMDELTELNSFSAVVFLESQRCKKDKRNPMNMITSIIMNGSYHPTYTVSEEHFRKEEAWKELYGLGRVPNYSTAYDIFENLAAWSEAKDKFYCSLLSAIAQFKLYQEERDERQKSLILRHALSTFKNIFEQYSGDYSLAFHLEVFGLIYDYFNEAKTADDKKHIYTLLLEAFRLLAKFSNETNFSLSNTQVCEMFDKFFDAIANSKLLEEATNWDNLINSYTKEIKSVKDKKVAMTLVHQLHDMDSIAQYNKLETIRIPLKTNLVHLFNFHLNVLDHVYIKIAIQHLNYMDKADESGKYEYSEVYAKLYTQLFLVSLGYSNALDEASVNYLRLALSYASYPENSTEILCISQHLLLHKNNPAFEHNQDLMNLNKLALQARRSINPTISIAEMVALYNENYFPSLIKLTYQQMQHRHARRSFYLCARLYAEIMFRGEKLMVGHRGLTQSAMKSCTVDIFRYIASFHDSKNKYFHLAEWYLKLISLISWLALKYKYSSEYLDFDILLLGNARCNGEIFDDIKYSVKISLNKSENYVTSKLNQFENLRRIWGSEIVIAKETPRVIFGRDFSPVIQMSFFRNNPLNPVPAPILLINPRNAPENK